MVAATVPIGGAIIGGLASSDAASSAADAQVAAGAASNATQLEMYNRTRNDQLPAIQAGQRAIGQLSAGTADGGDFNRDFTMADFTRDPGYEFRMGQGQKALEASAAARGGVLNGGTLKALSRYGQDFASNEYSNAYNRFNNDRTTRFNRLSSIAGTGQTANNTMGALGQQTAYQIGQTQQGIGNARASGTVGGANAINNGLQSLSNYYMQRQFMQPPAVSPNANNPAWGGWGGTTTDPWYG